MILMRFKDRNGYEHQDFRRISANFADVLKAMGVNKTAIEARLAVLGPKNALTIVPGRREMTLPPTHGKSVFQSEG